MENIGGAKTSHTQPTYGNITQEYSSRRDAKYTLYPYAYMRILVEHMIDTLIGIWTFINMITLYFILRYAAR